MGEKWDEISIFHSPISPFYPDAEDLLAAAFVKFGTQMSSAKMEEIQGIRRYPPSQVLPRLAFGGKAEVIVPWEVQVQVCLRVLGCLWRKKTVEH